MEQHIEFLNDVILGLKIMAVSFAFTQFDPLQRYIDNLFETKFNDRPVYDDIHVMLGCFGCISFWITLIVTFNIFAAGIVLIVAAYIYKHLDIK